MKVTFTDKDWDKLRNFQNSFNQKLGLQSYVGTDNACVFVEYSPTLKAMLRPFPNNKQYTFEFRALKCEDCPQEQPFLCAENETVPFVCYECDRKREEKKKKEREKSQRAKTEKVG